MPRKAPMFVWRPQRKPDGSPGPQELALRSSAFEIGMGGARGGGKTDEMIMWMAYPAITGESWAGEYRGLLLRKNATDLKDYMARATRIYRRLGGVRSGSLITFPSGGVLNHDHLATKDAYQKYQGHEYQRIGCEELTQIPLENMWEMILGSCRSTVKGLQPQAQANFNPGGPGHGWVRKRFVDLCPPNQKIRTEGGMSRVFIPARLEDNPILRKADPRYERYLMSLPEKLRKAWRWGDWDCLEGMYFPEFARKLHVIEPFRLPAHWPRARSMDWGYWPDPWVCLWWASDEIGRQFLYREAHGYRMTPEKVAARVLELSADDPQSFGITQIDPEVFRHEDGISTGERLFASGLPVVAADNTRVQGWMRIHEYLEEVFGTDPRPMIQIFSSCLKCIETLPQMVHDEKDPMDCLDNSQIDHWPDTMRYHLMSRPAVAKIAPKEDPWYSLSAMRRRHEARRA